MMSKTKALKLAAAAHGEIRWYGLGWGFACPYTIRATEINGRRDIREGYSYQNALNMRTDSITGATLSLMGIKFDIGDWYIYGSGFSGSARDRVNAWLAKAS